MYALPVTKRHQPVELKPAERVRIRVHVRMDAGVADSTMARLE